VILPPPPAPSRSPWQLLYGALLARRRRRSAPARLPRPVVSVGNLHWGGGGKTPFTIALARHLDAGGRRVAILSRGYGRTTRGARVVSRGAGPVLDVREAGDEPFQMARALPGVAVVVGERRAAAGALALEALEPAPELFLLDDGFSHIALARDVDLLLFPAADPWAGGRLAPTGRLREPLAAAAGADAVVLTGLDAPGSSAGEALAGALRVHGFAGPGFASATVAASPRLSDGAPLAAGTPVLALAAIARPSQFFAAVSRAGVALRARRSFRDHHPFGDRDLEEIARQAEAAGARVVLTTEKDLPRLEGRLRLPLAVLPVEARPEGAFWSWLDARLGTIPR